MGSGCCTSSKTGFITTLRTTLGGVHLHCLWFDYFVSAAFQRASVPLTPRSQSHSRTVMTWPSSSHWLMARKYRRAVKRQPRRRSSMFLMNRIPPRADVWLKTMTPPRAGWTTASTRVGTLATMDLVLTGPILAVLEKVKWVSCWRLCWGCLCDQGQGSCHTLLPVTGWPPGRHFKKEWAEKTRARDRDKQRHTERVQRQNTCMQERKIILSLRNCSSTKAVFIYRRIVNTWVRYLDTNITSSSQASVVKMQSACASSIYD